MKNFLRTAAVIVIAATMAACSSQKGPADAAIKAAEGALASARAEADRYVPHQVKAAEDAITAARDQFGKGDFQGALKLAAQATATARDLSAAAIEKKAELTHAWDEASGSLPKLVDSIRDRVEVLAKSRKLPKGIDKATLAKAKEGLATASSAWDEAQKEFSSGDIAAAIEKAAAVREQGSEILALLGMQDAAPSAK